MTYAEVAINSPFAQRQSFSYAVPSHLSVRVGQAVFVPFGQKILQGIVIEVADTPAYQDTAEIREIDDVIDPSPLLSPVRVSLARWISRYYLSPLFDAVALMLPPGFERKALTFVSLAENYAQHDLSSLSPEARELIDLLREKGQVNQKELEKHFGKTKAPELVSGLVKRGILARSYQLEPVRVKAKKVPYLRLTVSPAQAREIADRLRPKAEKQAVLLDFLAEHPELAPWSQLRTSLNVSKSTADALAGKGLVTFEQIEVKREPIAYQNIAPTSPLNLTPDQQSAFNAVKEALGKNQPGVFLLQGVTASGKTEIYLQALAEAVRRGKKGIVLVPEIALTPQTIERFAARFPGKVAVLHSRLTPGEQFDEWRRIRSGAVDVAIGPRSALFAPQPDLGLIVVDEEHEWTYKQDDKSPRYHARDVAIRLAELTSAVVVMGSATPDTVSYYHTQRGDYELLHLPERVVPTVGAALPGVEVVDLREELKAGNRSIFSRSLTEAINQALANSEQVILFLNRRGGATFVQCRHCGFVLRCRRCEIPMTYHPNEDRLVCHQCNYRTPAPVFCPRCGSRQIKYLGIGTQKVEQEARVAFPGARLLRWDSDVTRSRQSHQRILNQFRAHEADILIGTQMVAKGLDLPQVTLVGVITADTSLNLPDFRSGERTFQLLSQVAGRAGRGPLGGQVIVQTFAPEHYAIQAAAEHDYAAFYEKEIHFRRGLRNPPFSRLALLTYSHTNEFRCQREAERMKQQLVSERDAKGIDDIDFIGPAPAFIHRLRGRFRWQIILRGVELSAFLQPVRFPQGWTVDIDPASLL